MAIGQIGNAVRNGRLKEFIGASIFLANGLAFHIFGSGRRILGFRDSWQSETRMRRELGAWFNEIKVTSNERLFLIEATHR